MIIISKAEYKVLKKIKKLNNGEEKYCPDTNDFISSFKHLKNYKVENAIQSLVNSGLITNIFDKDKYSTKRAEISETGLCALKEYRKNIRHSIYKAVWDIIIAVLTAVITILLTKVFSD